MFTSVKHLRTDVNNLYDSRLETNEVEIFDLMLLRDFSKASLIFRQAAALELSPR